MKKILISATLLLALTSCFWNTPSQTTSTGTLENTSNTGSLDNSNATGTLDPKGTASSSPSTTTKSTSTATTPTSTGGKEPDLNSAKEQKIVDDFQKEIDGLLKLMDNNGTK